MRTVTRVLIASIVGGAVMLTGIDMSGAFTTHIEPTAHSVCAARTMMFNPCATLDPSNIDDYR